MRNKLKRGLIISVVIFLTTLFAGNAFSQGERNFIFDYDLVLKNIQRDASRIKIWVPFPTERPYQKVEYIKEKTSLEPNIIYDKRYNNRILHYSANPPESSSLEINLHYKIKRYEYMNKPGIASNDRGAVGAGRPDNYLKPSRLVTISPRVKRIAASITRGKTRDVEKARAIYDYVFYNVAYDKTVPGWGKGDTERVCDIKKGNCTDFHSLFISLARASGIPAKFVIGVPIPSEKTSQSRSYHCWAEFYAKDYGWIPVDISEAWKDKTKYEYHFGTLDENRIELTHGRDIILDTSQSKESLNYFIYPYVEIDGKVFENVDTVFSFKDIE